MCLMERRETCGACHTIWDAERRQEWLDETLGWETPLPEGVYLKRMDECLHNWKEATKWHKKNHCVDCDCHCDDCSDEDVWDGGDLADMFDDDGQHVDDLDDDEVLVETFYWRGQSYYKDNDGYLYLAREQLESHHSGGEQFGDATRVGRVENRAVTIWPESEWVTYE